MAINFRAPVVGLLVAAGVLAAPGLDAQSFTTTEGTWISLDVSPNGQTIVFELLGDLYTMPVKWWLGHPTDRGPAVRIPAPVFAGWRPTRLYQ